MAGRGGVKLKEYRQSISSIKQWQSELQFPHLSVVEIFSTSFGHCQVILPTINSIMTNIPDSESRVRWLTVNVGKLEEEQKQKDEEKQKKDEDLNGKQRTATRTTAVIQPTPPLNSTDISLISPSEEHKEQDPSTSDTDLSDTPDPTPLPPAPIVSSTPTIPLLEAYHSYDHPRPLWLFFLNGVLQYELTSANPPKMHRLVQACLSGSQLSADELAGMELQTDSPEVAAEKKRKRLQKKKEEEEAKKKAREAEEAQQAKKKREIIRSQPEFLLHLHLSSYTNIISDQQDPAASAGKLPALVLYWKDGDSDFYFLAQTPRTAPNADGALVFPTAIPWKKPDSSEAEAHLDLKLALYEVDDDEPIKGEREGVGLLGEGYVNLAALRAGETQVQVIHRDLPTVPPLSPTTKSPRIPLRPDRVVGVVDIKLKDRVSEGVLSDYRGYVTVGGFAPASAPVEGAVGYVVSLSVLDDTTPVWVVTGVTEASTVLPLTFTTPLPFTHYSNLPRTLRLQLLSDNSTLLNHIEFPLTAALKASVTLPALDAAGTPSGVEFNLRVEEVDEEGNVIASLIEEVTAEEKERRAALEWIDVSFTAVNLPATPTPVLAVYRQEGAGAVTQLGQSEAVVSPSGGYSFTRTFQLPLDLHLNPSYKLVVLGSPDAAAGVVGQHVMEVSGLGVEGGVIDIPLETGEGVALGDAGLKAEVKRLGKAELMELEVGVAGFPAAKDGENVGVVVGVWKVVGDGKELVGTTERTVETSATFTTIVPVNTFTATDTPLVVSVHSVGEGEAVVNDSTAIASVNFAASALRYLTPTPLTLPLAAITGAALTLVNRRAIDRPTGEQPIPAETVQEAAVIEPQQVVQTQPTTLEALTLTFNIVGLEVTGPVTVKLNAGEGTESAEVGRTEGEVNDGVAAFAVPITLLGYQGGDRQFTANVERGAEAVGEFVLPTTALTDGSAESFPLTNAGQPLSAVATVRVNARYEAAPTTSPTEVPALPTEALQAESQPPASNSNKSSARLPSSSGNPPLSSRPTKASAPPTARSGSKAPSKPPSKAPSVQATPRSAREPSVSRKSPTTSQTKAQAGGEEPAIRPSSRSTSKKDPASTKSVKRDDNPLMADPIEAAANASEAPPTEAAAVQIEAGTAVEAAKDEEEYHDDTDAAAANETHAEAKTEGGEDEYADDTEAATEAAQ